VRRSKQHALGSCGQRNLQAIGRTQNGRNNSDEAPRSTYLDHVHGTHPPRLGLLLVFGGSLVAACNSLFGVDALTYESADGGGMVGTAGQGGTSSAGSGGQEQGGSGGNSPEPSGAVLWSRRFGGSGFDAGACVAVDKDGNIVVAGTFQESVDFGGGTLISAGGRDIFLLKLDPQGAYLWSRRFGGPTEDVVGGVAFGPQGNIGLAGDFRQSIDLGGGVLMGGSMPIAFTAVYSPSGAHLYSAAFGDGGWFAKDGTRDLVLHDDYFVLVGSFSKSIDFGSDKLYSKQTDMFVAKLSTTGAHQWSADYGEDDNQVAEAVALDSSANLLLTGDFEKTLAFGTHELESEGDLDVFVAKLDPSGEVLWGLAFGDVERQLGWAIGADASDNVFVGGSMQGTVDFGGGPLPPPSGATAESYDAFLLKLDGAGKHVFSARYGDASNQHLRALSVDHANNVLLTGELEGAMSFGGEYLVGSAGGVDMFIAKLAPDGAHLWSYIFGSSGDQYAWDVAATPSGQAVVTGSFEASLDFGGKTKVLNSAGNDDIFVAKLAH